MTDANDYIIIPKKMKAAVSTGFGEIDERVFIREDFETPNLPPSKKGKSKKDDRILIRVLACALAPGDSRVLSGKTDYYQTPAEGFPYVIGSDTSGIVVAAPENHSKFQVGDYVVARFDGLRPTGGIAEYRLVESKHTEKCPESIPPIEACGLPASGMAAMILVDEMKMGDRVLVIGGSGGVGSCVIQYAKKKKEASFIVAVSTQEEQCKSLGADKVIDYRNKNWWEIAEFQSNKFDVVFDLAGGDNWDKGGFAKTAIPKNGKYVRLYPGVQTEVEVHGPIGVLKLVSGMLGGNVKAALSPGLPKLVMPEALALKDGDLKGLFEDVVNGTLKPVLDPSSPFDFTEEGVRSAMHLQKSKHAHGKVVIKVSDK
jgi:NADPH:quinone reductase-like Zn-dependent oxidoreductase